MKYPETEMKARNDRIRNKNTVIAELRAWVYLYGAMVYYAKLVSKKAVDLDIETNETTFNKQNFKKL